MNYSIYNLICNKLAVVHMRAADQMAITRVIKEFYHGIEVPEPL